MWRVLLVEDEVFVRESVKELIRWEELGFTLAGEAGDGREALEQIKTNPPDLVITDIIMPRMDGIELLKETRERGYDCKFIMLTCLGEFEYVRQAMEYGASNYILKLSMSVNDLRDTLQKISRELAHIHSESQHSVAASQRTNRAKEAKTNHPEINKILDYIDENYDQDITVKSLSQYVMMSENYVSALFKKKIGKTLIHHLHEVRIAHARILLEETELPVHEIGARVGFMNDNYFIKIFKRIEGKTPAQYRQAIQNKDRTNSFSNDSDRSSIV